MQCKTEMDGENIRVRNIRARPNKIERNTKLCCLLIFNKSESFSFLGALNIT